VPVALIEEDKLTALLDSAWRASLAPPERLTIEEWCARNISLSAKETNNPGQFNIELAPYFRGVWEAFRDPAIEEIYLAWAAQTGKTLCELLALAYCVEQDPGPALWAMSTETIVKSLSKQRLRPLINENYALAAQKPADPDDFGILAMDMSRMAIDLVGSNSPTNLASRHIRYLFADEVDKWPTQTTTEGSLIGQAIRRTTTYWNHKIMVSSTPTTGDRPIWRALLRGDWRQYWVPCPHCGTQQVLVFSRIRKPEEMRDLDEIRKVAWYECEACGKRIENHHKPEMLNKGEWRPRATPAPEFDWKPPVAGGSRASFHLPSWYSLSVNFGQVLARFMEAAHDPAELRERINQDHAEPWQDRGEAATEKTLLTHKGEYADGHVPADAKIVCLIQTVDVQRNGFFYVVRAWGPGEESWLIAYGMLATWEQVRQTLDRIYDGHHIRVCFLDSGDGTKTDEVYAFCRSTPRCVPLKGSDQSQQLVSWSAIDKRPDGVAIAGSPQLCVVRSPHFRETLFLRLAIRKGDPGYWWLHKDVAEDYTQQILSHVIITEKDKRTGRERRYWRKIRTHDHYLACEVYNLAAAYVVGVRYDTGAKRESGSSGETDKKKDWIGKTEGWMR